MQKEIQEYVDKQPAKFVSVVNDKTLATKILINKAIEAKLILRRNQRYSTSDGLDLCYPGEVASFDNAIKYLEDPKNQEVKMILEAKLNQK